MSDILDSQEGNQAVAPDLGGNYSNIVKDYKQEPDTAMAKAQAHDAALSALAKSRGWKIFKERAEAKMNHVKSLVDLNVTGKESLAEIGMRFMIASTACNLIAELISETEMAAAVASKEEK